MILFNCEIELLFGRFNMQFTTSEIIVLLFCAITLIVSVVTLITVLKKNNNNRTEDELQRILLNQQSFAQSQNDRAIQLEQRLHLSLIHI